MMAMRRGVRWMAGCRRGAAAAAVMLATAPLPGCALPPEVNPVAIYNRISGADDAARLPPPGMDRPTPNLASVPPRPERPSPEVRAAITAGLAEDRARSRDPLVLRTVPAPGALGGARGEQPLPAGPPPRPMLSNAPRIPWSDPAPAPGPGPAAPAARTPAPAPPEMPERAPAPPPPDLLGPPPAPRL